LAERSNEAHDEGAAFLKRIFNELDCQEKRVASFFSSLPSTAATVVDALLEVSAIAPPSTQHK